MTTRNFDIHSHVSHEVDQVLTRIDANGFPQQRPRGATLEKMGASHSVTLISSDQQELHVPADFVSAHSPVWRERLARLEERPCAPAGIGITGKRVLDPGGYKFTSIPVHVDVQTVSSIVLASVGMSLVAAWLPAWLRMRAWSPVRCLRAD